MKIKFNGILTLFLALVVQICFAQEKTISGTVTDDSGEELPGVSILIKGTTKGTDTDFDGRYSIRAKVGDVLIFSYIGYKAAERTVGASNRIDVKMEEGNVLEEIVITGYRTQSKESVTGSTVQVSSEKLNDLATAAVDQALQGKVAGLTVSQTSGTPGATAEIRIRGISSINAGNEPLYVIDGVPINTVRNVSTSDATSAFSPLAALNPNIIESITVLKDAITTSQYGARGSNGVILITTKSGKSGKKTTFSYSAYHGVQNDAVTGPVPLTGANRLELRAEGLFNDDPASYANKQEAINWLLANDASTRAWDLAGRPEGNWGENVANKNSLIEEHNISASGGGEDHTFFGSIAYFKQEGTVIGSGFERITANLNFSKNLNDKIKFTTNTSAAHSIQDAFLERSAFFEGARTVKYFISPYVQPYNADGTPAEFGGSLPNSLILSRDNIYDNHLTRIISSNNLNWQLTDNLAYEFRFGVDYRVFNAKFYGNPTYGYSAATSGEASQTVTTTATYTIQNKLNYAYELSEDHLFDAILVQEYQADRRYRLNAEGDQFADTGLENLDSSGNITDAGSSFLDWRIGRYLGLISYNAFDSKYVLDFSYTLEGSSRFSPKNRWGNFWAVGGAWNIHKEGFLEDAFLVDNLKLRASYGTTGNANIGRFDYETLFNFDPDYDSQGAQVLGRLGNVGLSWEKSTTLDLGVDFTLLDNAISGTVAYFNRKTTDLLYDVPLPPSTGFESIRQNFGEVENKGIEVEINANIVTSDDFNVSIGGNIGTAKNKILSIPTDPNGEDLVISNTLRRIESGHPIDAWYLQTWAGVDTETGLDTYYLNGVDGEVTSNYNLAEQVFQGGNGVPTLTAGINIHVDYKGLFLDANGFYAGGHKIYEGWHLYLNQPNAYSTAIFNGFTTLLDRWQQPGDVARYPRVISQTQAWQRNSKFLHDGDYFRLRTVTFGYDLPSKFTERIKISGLRLFVRGNNLFTWQKDKNNPYDPETDLEGQTGLETPAIKTVMIGLNLNI